MKNKTYDVEVSRHGRKEILHVKAATEDDAVEIVFRSNIDLLWSDIMLLGEHK